MDNLILISSILGIHILAWLTPGPLFVLIIRNSLIYPQKYGMWTAFGIMVGNLIHIAFAVTGISLIISIYPLVFTAIQFLGIGYIVYLGINTFFMKIDTENANRSFHVSKDISPLHAVRMGFLTNIFSPKASLFFTSIFALIMIFFTQQKVKKVYLKYQYLFNKLLGIALLILALMISLQK
ncbi:LysE family translocator [Candidatus Woesearchaeota archaeon]|nr:LysE family translocator [Candidatus Woesearchaeota archaeon]